MIHYYTMEKNIHKYWSLWKVEWQCTNTMYSKEKEKKATYYCILFMFYFQFLKQYLVNNYLLFSYLIDW